MPVVQLPGPFILTAVILGGVIVQRYGNLGGDSGVDSYEATDDSITVKLVDGWTYEYNYATAGRDNVEEMKRLAAAGRRLDTFITKTVKRQYARRWR